MYNDSRSGIAIDLLVARDLFRHVIFDVPGSASRLTLAFFSICVCDAADKEQLRCLRWDVKHAKAYAASVQQPFPNLPLTYSLHSLAW